MNSYVAKPGSAESKWYVVDANGQTLGRMASRLQLFSAASTNRSLLRMWIPVTM